ncbi:hypothetical protein BASA83_007278 [Batrachochytrium salamandrivorans]|nr:hypothetical protein BASA62_003392 [Batrachochytrium salamandrivorans]KAH9270669.1 hypothetical protein BASA83_007278 [Batrachochytrium salamandrivorans]
MQFFHLFSFVVAASYAAALPQPAGLSGKYSNSVDTNLASGLEARSYQPVLNSKRDSAILMSLKRRDDSEGSPEDNSGGSPENNPEGSTENNSEGSTENNSEGSTENNSEGSTENNSEGSTENNSEGSTENNSEGSTENNSEVSTGENSESDPFFPFKLSPNETVERHFTDDDISTNNLVSTIKRVEDDFYIFFKEGEEAADKIGGDTGDRMKEYFRRNSYVNVALRFWSYESVPKILRLIGSGVGKSEYPKLEPKLTKELNEFKDGVRAGFSAVFDNTMKMLNNDGSDIDNFQNVDESFNSAFENQWLLVRKLRALLRKFKVDEFFYEDLVNVTDAVAKFRAKQNTIYDEVMQGLKAAPSQ